MATFAALCFAAFVCFGLYVGAKEGGLIGSQSKPLHYVQEGVEETLRETLTANEFRLFEQTVRHMRGSWISFPAGDCRVEEMDGGGIRLRVIIGTGHGYGSGMGSSTPADQCTYVIEINQGQAVYAAA